MPTAAFLRSAAICSVLSSASTLLLIYLPRFAPHVTTFEERIALATNPIHLTRLAVGILHPFLVLTAVMGVVLVPDPTYYTQQALGYAALPPALVMLAVSIMNGPVSRRVEPARAGGRDW